MREQEAQNKVRQPPPGAMLDVDAARWFGKQERNQAWRAHLAALKAFPRGTKDELRIMRNSRRKQRQEWKRKPCARRPYQTRTAARDERRFAFRKRRTRTFYCDRCQALHAV